LLWSNLYKKTTDSTQDHDIGKAIHICLCSFSSKDSFSVRLFSIVKLALSAICFLPVSACVQSSGDTIFEGIKTSRIIIEKNNKSQIGDLSVRNLPSQLADTMRVCWNKPDELFEGFKVNQNGNSITLNGPIIGNPPQRFLIIFSASGSSGYIIEMEYPKGSNYQFVRSRLIKDLRKIENGVKPC
jgi:hypothetical protein